MSGHKSGSRSIVQKTTSATSSGVSRGKISSNVTSIAGTVGVTSRMEVSYRYGRITTYF